MRNLISPGFSVKPKILVFFVSYNCDLRCAMCSGWVKQKQVKEPGLDEIRTVFNDNILKKSLQIINITGGEPTMRQDLSEIVRIILQNCSRLKRIDVSTNGFNTDRVLDRIEQLLGILLPTNVGLSVSVSLDGVGDTHEKVRQVPGVFKNVEKTIIGLKELMTLYPFLNIGLNMTISKLNYNALEATRKYALDRGLGINFTLAAVSDIGVESFSVKENFEMNQDEKNKVALFIKGLSCPGEIDKRYSKFVLTLLLKGKRKGRCAFKEGRSILLEPDGRLYCCGNYKEFGIGNIFKETFKEMSKRRGVIPRKAFGKCANCYSNCYLEG